MEEAIGVSWQWEIFWIFEIVIFSIRVLSRQKGCLWTENGAPLPSPISFPVSLLFVQSLLFSHLSIHHPSSPFLFLQYFLLFDLLIIFFYIVWFFSLDFLNLVLCAWAMDKLAENRNYSIQTEPVLQLSLSKMKTLAAMKSL